MKKSIICFLLIFLFTSLNCINAFASSDPPSITGESVVVMDANTGVVVYGKNENVQYPPASTTKLMTVLLTLENCNLDEVVTVGENPPTIEGSKIYIDAKEKMTVEEMLYAVIMVSANDCATALAEHISGTVEEFAKLMNTRAKELGCLNTNFTNPHGLYEETHRTTAYDLALIEKELLKYPKYIEISKTTSTFLPPTNIFKEQRPLWNDNRLLHNYYSCYYPDVIAGKTGYTDESLHSFVASAKKGENAFIIGILYDKAKAYYNETPRLFDWAFENFKTEKALSKGDVLDTYTAANGAIIPLIAKEDVYYTKKTSSEEKPVITIDTASLKDKFFNLNDEITTATITYENQSYTVNILSGSDYKQETLPVVGTMLTTEKNEINYTRLYLLIGGSIVGSIIVILIVIRLIKKAILAKKRRKIFGSSKKNRFN